MSNKPVFGKDLGKEKIREQGVDPTLEPLAMAMQAHTLAQTMLAYYAGVRAWQTPVVPGASFEGPWNPWAASFFPPSPFYGSSPYYAAAPAPYGVAPAPYGTAPAPGIVAGPAGCTGAAGCCGPSAQQKSAGGTPLWVSPWASPYASYGPMPYAAPYVAPYGSPWTSAWPSPMKGMSAEPMPAGAQPVEQTWRHFTKY